VKRITNRGCGVPGTLALAVALAAGSAGGALLSAQDRPAATHRLDALARAQVWKSTNIPAMDLRRGPEGPGSFSPDALVVCDYVDHELSGNTPKFTCRLPGGDDVKVKYGNDNGEVYAEVAATRLLWALGFGADRMYPVKVRCRGCPETPGMGPPSSRVRVYDVAAIERKMPGRELDDPEGSGWSWAELDQVDPRRGGAPVAHRDALKLLASLLQHTDSKPEQQRIMCLDEREPGHACPHPFLMISDLGKTFGRANRLNKDGVGSTNLDAWASVPVWAEPSGCRANLEKSMTGTLDNPVISERGRAFLEGLLARLTDRQLQDLFTVARFPLRTGTSENEAAADVSTWVNTFKAKVAQVRGRRCEAREPRR
jgi:hypothetical protein